MNYSNQAAEKGVYIIGSCGFDSIPADMGVLYTRDQFKGMHIFTWTHLMYAQNYCSSYHGLSICLLLKPGVYVYPQVH